MAMQKVEFEFPDEKGTEIEVEGSSMETLDFSNPGKKPAPEKKKQEAARDDDSDIDLEIVDDTPEEDRNRKPSEPPADPTEDELESYSEKVRQRIKHFTKGYHDERRAKEAAERERQELEAVAKRLMEENRQLKESGSKSQAALLAQAKKNATAEYEAAKATYKKAYDDGDGDKLLEAQEKLTDAKNRLNTVNNYKLPTLQNKESSVQVSNNTSEPVTARTSQSETPVDERAAKWAKENTWFQKDPEMTSYALGLHTKMVNEGVDPKSDEYYERLNSRIRQVFPEQFGDERTDAKQSRASDNVVAPNTRSTAPKKVRLSQSQVRVAKRLGLTPEQYAKQVALEMRKNNG